MSGDPSFQQVLQNQAQKPGQSAFASSSGIVLPPAIIKKGAPGLQGQQMQTGIGLSNFVGSSNSYQTGPLLGNGVRQCPYCGRRCQSGSALENHIRIHTGESPFTCPILGCDKAFKQRSQQYQHMRNKHNIDTNKLSQMSGGVLQQHKFLNGAGKVHEDELPRMANPLMKNGPSNPGQNYAMMNNSGGFLTSGGSGIQIKLNQGQMSKPVPLSSNPLGAPLTQAQISAQEIAQSIQNQQQQQAPPEHFVGGGTALVNLNGDQMKTEGQNGLQNENEQDQFQPPQDGIYGEIQPVQNNEISREQLIDHQPPQHPLISFFQNRMMQQNGGQTNNVASEEYKHTSDNEEQNNQNYYQNEQFIQSKLEESSKVGLNNQPDIKEMQADKTAEYLQECLQEQYAFLREMQEHQNRQQSAADNLIGQDIRQFESFSFMKLNQAPVEQLKLPQIPIFKEYTT